MQDHRIVIFDGVCNLCNGAVNFIVKRDSAGKFLFTPMQSALAQELVEKYNVSNVGKDAFLLIKDDRTYIWTDAALEIASELDGHWHLCRAFKIIPRPICDWCYRQFARNRYTLFGRTDACVIPSAEIRSRFIGL